MLQCNAQLLFPCYNLHAHYYTHMKAIKTQKIIIFTRLPTGKAGCMEA